MKKIASVSIIVIVFLLIAYSNSYTNANQPPAGRTGCNVGPGESTCGATTCHNNTPNSGPGSVSVTYSDTNFKYALGETYDLTVSTSEAGKVKFGFEITVVDADGDSVGTFIIPNGTTNISAPAAGAINHRKYLAHKNASSTNSWSFQWKAPVTDRGDLTFFVAGNCANGNNSSSGDHIYTTSLSVTPDVSTGVFNPLSDKTNFQIESITYGQLNVNYNQVTGERVMIRLFDLKGNPVQTLVDEEQTAGIYHQSFKLASNLTNGLYLLNYHSGENEITRKIFFQH